MLGSEPTGLTSSGAWPQPASSWPLHSRACSCPGLAYAETHAGEDRVTALQGAVGVGKLNNVPEALSSPSYGQRQCDQPLC